MTLQALFASLRVRWPALLLCLVAGVLGAHYATAKAHKVYESSGVLLINIPQARSASEALQGVQLSSQLLTSYARLGTSLTAAEEIQRVLQLPEAPAAIQASLTAASVPDTLLITVSATDGDPARAQAIATAAGQVLIGRIARLEQGKQDPVEAQVIDAPTLPSSPVRPRPRVNLAVGVLVGLGLGWVLVAVLNGLDRSVKTPAQVMELLEVPLLAAIPKARAATINPAAVAEQATSPVIEAFKSLRTSLRYVDLAGLARTILVTSPSPGDGKTMVAANLAVALAQSGERVVLVDADLRRPALGSLLGLPEGLGVTTVVSRQAQIEDVAMDWRGLLTVVGAGPPPPNPAELVDSRGMVELLQRAVGEADVVIIDTPPVMPVTDAVALSAHVDAVLVVVRAGRTLRVAASETRRRLDAVGANVVGCVLNGTSARMLDAVRGTAARARTR